ncbi:MAG TPA: biotin/lipoyl-binding protein [Candidatus Sumerlaeota bacterium]|nr:biotin/lipoyl-binding protein [Candidatus Sumerlaeota bacterium]
MRTLYPILILTLTLCFGGPLFAEETTQTETAKGAKGTSQPQVQTVPKPEAKKEAPPAAQPQSSPTPAPAVQPEKPQETGKTQLLGVQDSGAYTPRNAKITRVENKPIPEIKDIPKAIEQNLFPGESCTFAGVTIQWEVNENEIPKSAGEWAPLGHLHVRGPVNRIEDIDTGMQANWERKVIDMRTRPTRYQKDSVPTPPSSPPLAYVDNVSVVVENAGDNLGTNAHLALQIEYRPSHKRYWASTRASNDTIYLSSACPVTLNEWELRLSDKPVRSSDGSEQLQITIRNGKTGEKFELPAIGGAMRRFGRFETKVHTVYPSTRTAIMGVDVSLDKTIRGREAAVTSQFKKYLECGTGIGESLDVISKECGFEVEWSGFDGFGPEAAAYARSQTHHSTWDENPILAKDFVDKIMDEHKGKLEAVWTDDTHLRIRPIGYEEMKKEEEKEARKQASREEAYKGLAAQREEATRKFEAEYALETRIYHLKAISPEAAAQLIRKQLNTYYLLEKPYDMTQSEDGTIQIVNEEGLAQLHFVDKKKEGQEPEKVAPPNVYIRRAPEGKPRQAKQLTSIEESTVADSRTNSLLVTALPKTQEIIGGTIGRMEEAFEQELKSVAEKAVPRRRLEVILLQGTTNDSEETSTSEFRGYFGMGGMIEKILVKPGQTVKKGDLLAQLDMREAEAQYEKAVTFLKREQAVLEEKKNILKTAEQQFAVGTRPESEVAAARLAVKEQDARLVQPEQIVRAREIHLKMCELRAPEDGVVTEVLAQPREEFRPAGANTQPVLKITRKMKTESENSRSLEFGQDGTLRQIMVKEGQAVKKGDLLAQLDKQEIETQYKQTRAELEKGQASLEEGRNKLKAEKEAAASVSVPNTDLEVKRKNLRESVWKRTEELLEQAESQLKQTETQVKRMESQVKACDLCAPEDGVVTEILLQPNEPVTPGQPVVKITLDSKPEPANGESTSSTLTTQEAPSDSVTTAAKKYGINPDDLKFFHFTDLEERGRTILTLGETTGKEGKAAADLGGGPYRCEFEYQAWRTPYLVVNARLQGPSSGEAGSKPKGLIENTLYLQDGVPSVLGITNLREGLILVVRLAAPPAQPASTDQPAPAPSEGAAPPDTEAK